MADTEEKLLELLDEVAKESDVKGLKFMKTECMMPSKKVNQMNKLRNGDF